MKQPPEEASNIAVHMVGPVFVVTVKAGQCD